MNEQEENVSNREFIIRRISLMLEQEQVMAAIYHCRTYARIIKDEEMLKFLEKYMFDVKFFRRLKLREAIILNPATVYEYYDRDRGAADPFIFDEKLEKDLMTIKAKISDFIEAAITEGAGEGVEEALARLKEIHGE